MIVRAIEIPRADWSRALEAFSAIHEGWLVSLDVLSPSIGAQPEIAELPLVGVTFEPDDEGLITLTVAPAASGHMTHAVRSPAHVWIERTDTGADVALDIESADGTQAILRFRTPALPETVDGMVR